MAGLEDEEEENYVRLKRPDTQEGSPEGPGEAASGLGMAVTVGGANKHKNSPAPELSPDRAPLVSHREPLDSETA